MTPVTVKPGAQERARISPQSRRHLEIRKAAIASHPELHGMTGPDARTVWALPVILTLHWGVAWAVSDAPIWAIFLVAFTAGQILIHAAGSLVHETAHKLIFRDRGPKLAFDLGLEVILSSYGKQLTYQHEHISSHHPYMGDYERDYEHEDICAFQARETLKARNPALQHVMTTTTLFIHALPLGSILGDDLIRKINQRASGLPQSDPARDIGATKPPPEQVRLFIAVPILSNVVLLLLLGPWALLYHIWALSLFLGKFGVWNLGQSLSEHDGADDHTPTRSYYGWLNRLLFNTGYHNEHHSFPNVPWTRLPKLRDTAPEVFNVEAEKSYAGYWFDHVINDFRTSRRNRLQSIDQTARCSGGASPGTGLGSYGAGSP